MVNQRERRVSRNPERLGYMLIFVLELFFLGVLGAIVYEDFTERRVHVFLFVIGYILTILINLIRGLHIEFLVVNLVFILINSVGIFSYSFFKEKRIKGISEWFGLGDVLMWGILIFYFSPINFILFFILSLLFSLTTYFLLFRKQNAMLPLAGNQALCLFIVILVNMSGIKFSFYSDDIYMMFFM